MSKKFNTSFGAFAKEYDERMGDNGDYTHQNSIDPALFDLLANVKGLKIYDVGCGNGYIARKLVKNGASEVWASDISPELIDIAKTKYPVNGIKYSVQDAADFKGLPEGYFDIVIMNMAIFYVENLEKFAKGIAKILKKDGRFIFSYDHPLRYVAGKDTGRELDPVEEIRPYLQDRAVSVYNTWTKRNDINIYYRPMGSYINTLSDVGLMVSRVREPETRTMNGSTPVHSAIPSKFVIETTKIA